MVVFCKVGVGGDNSWKGETDCFVLEKPDIIENDDNNNIYDKVSIPADVDANGKEDYRRKYGSSFLCRNLRSGSLYIIEICM